VPEAVNEGDAVSVGLLVIVELTLVVPVVEPVTLGSAVRVTLGVTAVIVM
jgi:hypothetical protein